MAMQCIIVTFLIPLLIILEYLECDSNYFKVIGE